MSGTTGDCFHLTVAIVREIHAEIIARFGGSDGVRDMALLESAVTGPTPQPASTSNAGAAKIAAAFNSSVRAHLLIPCDPFSLAHGIEPSVVA